MKKIISVDLGHGETAAAFVERNNVKPLHFSDRSAAVYSRIFISEEQMAALSKMDTVNYEGLKELGGFLIGNFQKQIGCSGVTYNYFKVQPSRFDEAWPDALSQKYGITHGMVMSCFAYEVIDQILRSNLEINEYNRSNTTLLVGCPTSEKWTEQAYVEQYRELIINATGMEKVVIIPESRAAMFSTVTGGKGSAVAADLGALVFDFGSSTADCTYMWMGKKLWEFSWRLGASMIEESLYDYVVEDYNRALPENDKIDFEQNVKSMPESTRVLRGVKEEFFSTGNSLEAICSIDKTESKKRKIIPVDLDESLMDRIVKNSVVSFRDDDNRVKSGCWYDLCRDFYTFARSEITSQSVKGETCPIGSIVITGGASKMPFIRELCEEVYPDCEIHLEENPAFSVSNGLCWAFLGEENLQDCIKKALEDIKESGICGVDSLVSEISNLLYDPLMDIISRNADVWAASGVNLPMENLINDIIHEVSTEQVQKQFSDVIRKANYNWEDTCAQEVRTAVLKQAKRLYSDNLPLSSTAVKGVDNINIQMSFDGMVDDVCNGLIGTIKTVILTIIIALIGAIVLFLFPPVSTVIGGALILLSRGIAEDVRIPDALKQQNLAGFIRNRVANNIRARSNNSDKREETVAKLKESVKEQIYKGGFSDEEFEQQLETTVKNSIEVMLLKKFD